MINQPKDSEIEKIQQKKMAEMPEHALAKPLDKPIVVTDGTFSSEIAKHNLMVVDFWAPWCGPCRMVGPLIEQLAAEYAGKVVFGKMNVDENQAVAGKFDVLSIPTLVVLKNGKAVETVIGACSKSHIESMFKRYVGKSE